MSGNRGPCPCMRAGFWPLTILECPIHGDTRGHELDRLRAELEHVTGLLAEARTHRGNALDFARERQRELAETRTAGDSLAAIASVMTEDSTTERWDSLGEAIHTYWSVRGDARTAPAADVRDPATRSTGLSREERVDRLTAAVDNVCDVAAIEVEVHELETGPAGWQRSGRTSPLRRLVRALEGAGMLDADDLNGGPADDGAAPGESIDELREELALRRSGMASAPPCTDGYWRNERHPPPPSATSGENADPREDT